MIGLALTLAFAFIESVHAKPCIASNFGSPDDKYGSSPTLWTGKPVTEFDIGIAHRKLPLGSIVIVQYMSRFTLAIVMDRGPYGAGKSRRDRSKHTWYIKAKRRSMPPPRVCDVLESQGRRCKPLRWRGCADLTPRTAQLIGHPGWGKVMIYRTWMSFGRHAPSWYHEASKQWRKEMR